MNEGWTACGLVFGIILVAVAVAVAGNKRQAAGPVKRARYVVHVPTEETRVRHAVEKGEVNGLTELPLVKKVGDTVQVWRGKRHTDYYVRGNSIMQETGVSRRKAVEMEDCLVLRQVMGELGQVEIVWE